jgi:hypothetical protein
MFKLQLFAVVLFGSLFFNACSEEEATSSGGTASSKLKTKLSQFEKNLSLNVRRGDYTLEEVRSSINHYDSSGENLLNAIDSLSAFIATQKRVPGSTYENDVKPFVEGQIPALNTSNIEFNSEETLLYDSFAKRLQFIDAISLVKEYEMFVFDNYADQSKVRNFQVVISNIKFASYSAKRNRLSQWEICADNCMAANYEGYNFVDWIQFAINPGADVLWSYASCGWDCA